MNILLLYSSTEGQTKKVADRVASIVRAAGHEILVHHMSSDQAPPPIGSFDAVICAASVHQGYHQESATDFVSAQAAELGRKPTAFISVSLSAAMDDGREEAQHYVDRFVEATHWSPTMTLLLGGAVRLSGYDYFERQVMKHIIMQRGVAHDLNVDYECTDWTALETFVRDFLDAAPTEGKRQSEGLSRPHLSP
ncbi:flavodoxin domain-containing protein [Hyphomicrobium sp.]|uniref:flavodoxin domain-containing protein n=1 Tax=Hyphomicrobium sp. TaxID=82 RepID=UPI0025C189E3|nr:flavodoxin domain-containing protein [Hyphomicrobium sp.]MCC7252573.1 protoporphyrinogen oxidase [Hyphomicrobium sp.]